jgi:hypothetical protein
MSESYLSVDVDCGKVWKNTNKQLLVVYIGAIGLRRGSNAKTVPAAWLVQTEKKKVQ